MIAELGVGVIGVGTIGRQHAENVAWRIPGARLVAVADARPETASEVAERLAVPRWYDSADELTADPNVQAVVIASSPSAHREGIEAAARGGKDILCEKPVAASLADADAAIAAAEDAGVRLQIGFMRRYDAAYAAAKRHIEAGAIGTPVLMKATHRNPSLPPSFGPSGAGPYIDAAIHDYDNARWLLGDEVTEVHAVSTAVSEPSRTDDLALSTLRFDRGGLATVEVYLTCGYGYDVRTEVAGTEGTVFIGSVPETGCIVATASGVNAPAVSHWLGRFGDAYLLQVKDWVRRMRGDEAPAVSGADGRAALEIAVAAKRSADENRSVRLPLAD